MKLWLISQTKNNGYDTHDSAVVAAETEDAARNIHPSGYYDGGEAWHAELDGWGTWALPEHVTAVCIGDAAPGTEPGVICASFNAG